MGDLKTQIDDFNQKDKGLTLTLDEGSHLPERIILRIQGHGDTSNAPLLMSFLEKVINQSIETQLIIFDLEGINYLSSTGIGAFSRLLILCQEKNIRLRLCSIPPKIRSVFDLLGFSQFFDIYSTMDEAAQERAT